MYRDESLELFVKAIKEKIPERGKLTNKLVEVLKIEKEAVYRRMRGEVPFIFSEVVAISKALDLSLDTIITPQSSKSRPFQLKLVDYFDPEEDDYTMLEEFLDGLRKVEFDPNSEVGGALNIIPPSFCLGFKRLYQFHLFKWRYQFSGNSTIKRYSEIQPTEHLLKINKEIRETTRKAAHTYLIWDQATYYNLINDLLYFVSVNLVTKEEAKELQKEIYEFLDLMEEVATRGGLENGKKIHLYVSSVSFETSYSYIETKDHHLTMIKSFTLNDATTTDEVIFRRMKNWMQSLKRTSTIISESGEMQRIFFFDKQREEVKKLDFI